MVLAPLVAERDADAEIRIWVPACATGEEVYSLAMLVVARSRAMHKTLNLKIFATDSQETNLAVARDGT
jgi:chemotaxis methyl-accepting protein methylase